MGMQVVRPVQGALACSGEGRRGHRDEDGLGSADRSRYRRHGRARCACAEAPGARLSHSPVHMLETRSVLGAD
jgi:hypothetical protein